MPGSQGLHRAVAKPGRRLPWVTTPAALATTTPAYYTLPAHRVCQPVPPVGTLGEAFLCPLPTPGPSVRLAPSASAAGTGGCAPGRAAPAGQRRMVGPRAAWSGMHLASLSASTRRVSRHIGPPLETVQTPNLAMTSREVTSSLRLPQGAANSRSPPTAAP